MNLINQSIIGLTLLSLLTACGGETNSDEKEGGDFSGIPNSGIDSEPEGSGSEVNEPEVNEPVISRSWSQSEFLELDGGDTSIPSVDINNLGASVVAWAQEDGTDVNVKVAYSASGESWTTSTLNSVNTKTEMESANYRYIRSSFASAKINDAGSALAAWSFQDKEDNSLNGIAVSQFDINTKSWASQTVISRNSEGIYDSLSLELNESGKGAVVWAQVSEGSKTLYLSTYSPLNQAWSEPSALASGNIGAPQVVLSSTGEITVVFLEYFNDLPARHLYSMTVSASGIASEKKQMDTQSTYPAEHTLTINQSDRKILTWTQKADSNGQLDPWVSISEGGEWGESMQIDSIYGRSSAPQATLINNTGELLLVWTDARSGNNNSIYRGLFSAVLSPEGLLSEIENLKNSDAYVPNLVNPENGTIWLAWGGVTIGSFKNGQWADKRWGFATYARGGVKIDAAKNGEGLAVWVNSQGGSQNLKYSKLK